MYQELVKVLMNNLKNLLPFKIILILVLIYVYIVTDNELYNTNYLEGENQIVGTITQINVSENKITLIIKSKEKILVNYYLNNQKNIKNLKCGYLIKVKGTLKRPNENTNFNLFNYRHYLLSQKIYWILQLESYEIIDTETNLYYKIKNHFYERIENIKLSKKYLKAFILGENDIDENIMASYRFNGISHLLAISGMHVTLISLIILYILNLVSKNKLFNYFLVILFIIFYMFLTSLKPPIIRSSLLFLIFTLNKIFNTKINTLQFLISLAIFLLLINPYYIYDLGFKFSFIVSFYLILFKNLFINKKYF